MEHLPLPIAAGAVGVIDGIARAAHRWVRHSGGIPARTRDPAHLAFVSGVIEGLSDELYRQDGATGWVAYVYALLDGYGADALQVAADVLAAGSDPRHQDACERGYTEGTTISAWFRVPETGT